MATGAGAMAPDGDPCASYDASRVPRHERLGPPERQWTATRHRHRGRPGHEGESPTLVQLLAVTWV